MKRVFCIFLFLFMTNSFCVLAYTNQDCLGCHESLQPKVDTTILEKSVHNSLSCISCHIDINAIPHKSNLSSVNCNICHISDAEKVARGSHGGFNKKGLPTCKTCHGTHNIFKSNYPDSKINHFNLSVLCLTCHKSGHYEIGIHSEATQLKGLTSSPDCTTCHGSHLILAKDNPLAPIYFSNTPETCGSCHQKILDDYKDSTHGELLIKGNKDVPACSTCHSEHSMKRIERISLYGIETKECGNCHLDKSKIYQDTYHGRATFTGFIRAALCTDCHGKHLILPKNDPNSMISSRNIDYTCGKCHGMVSKSTANDGQPAISSGYGKYQIHNSFSQVMLFKLFYMAVIILAIAGFLIHYLIIGPKEFDEEEKIYWFTLGNRLVHWGAAINFVILIITGLIIIFADVLGGGNFILISRYIHRICAFFFILCDIFIIIMWWRYFTTKKYDIEWLMVLGGYLSKKKIVVPADKFNFGQKLWLILSSIGGIIMFITGFAIMLLPPDIKLLRTSIYLHNIFGLFLVGFFMIHLYMSIFVIKGSINTMITGYKSREEAEIMHGRAIKKEK